MNSFEDLCTCSISSKLTNDCVARVDRLKEAKSEAESIIAAYRAELEAKYQTALSKVCQLLIHHALLHTY